MIAIIDYKMGNLRSVQNALSRLGATFEVTADAATIRRADHVLLPGVGNCAEAMHNLRESGLIPVIKQLRQPVLGICVGLQVMCRDSEEGAANGQLTTCMNIFDAHVRRFPDSAEFKVPHMGWNTLGNLEKKLFDGIHSGDSVYYVHSHLVPRHHSHHTPRPDVQCRTKVRAILCHTVPPRKEWRCGRAHT